VPVPTPLAHAVPGTYGQSVPTPPPLRRTAATRLRGLADRLDPLRRNFPGRPSAPLIRFGGRWWHRDEIVAPADAAQHPADELDP
jgi:hypothetical protein